MNPALDRVPAGVMTLGDDMRVVSANEGMAVLTGLTPEALVGESVDVLLDVPSRVLFQTHVYPLLKAEGRVDEMLLQLANAAVGSVPVMLNAVRDKTSHPTRYHVVVVRFEARARWESELLAATRALERERAATQVLADELAARHEREAQNRRYRDAFMGVLSHELRTPITTIYGLSHILRERLETMPTAVVGQHLEDIEAEADRLHRLTEDLLVISRVEVGRLQIAPEPIQLARLIERSVKGEAGRAPGRRFVVELPDDLPLVAGDDIYVEQVLRNYLSNAVKYSPSGTNIHVQSRAEDAGVAVRVLDAGAGLGEQSEEQLFELFYRAPQAMRLAAGAGIGLFVCRELVAAMSGRVWASNRPSGGSEFGFWLPQFEI